MILDTYYTPNDCQVFPALLISSEVCPCCRERKLMFDFGFLWWGFQLVFGTGYHVVEESR